MERTGQTGRIEVIQALRAVAALLVVLVHAINVTDFRPDWHRGFLATTSSINEFGGIGVDIFFVISGFVMANTVMTTPRLGAVRFLKARVLRVVPLYWLLGAAYGALLVMLGRQIVVGSALESLTLFPLADPMTSHQPVLVVGWSLAFEMAFYGVVAIALALRVPRHRLLDVLALGTGLMAMIGWLCAPAPDLLAILFNPIWGEFTAGILIYRLWRTTLGQLPTSGGRAACAIAAMTVFSLLIASPPFSSTPEALLNDGIGAARLVRWGLPSAAIVFAALWWAGLPEREALLRGHASYKALLALGDASYSLYLSHMFVMICAECLLPKIAAGTDVLTLTMVALSCGLAMFVHRHIETPLVKALRDKPIAAMPIPNGTGEAHA